MQIKKIETRHLALNKESHICYWRNDGTVARIKNGPQRPNLAPAISRASATLHKVRRMVLHSIPHKLVPLSVRSVVSYSAVEHESQTIYILHRIGRCTLLVRGK